LSRALASEPKISPYSLSVKSMIMLFSLLGQPELSRIVRRSVLGHVPCLVRLERALLADPDEPLRLSLREGAGGGGERRLALALIRCGHCGEHT
jgi:hypothetical protein